MGPVELGHPTFTTLPCGIVGGVVTVRTLEEPRHSGVHGGPAPDALMALTRMLATLTDERGNCTIAGIPGSEWPGADYPEDAFRSLAWGCSTACRSSATAASRRGCSRPSVTVVGTRRARGRHCPNAIIPMAPRQDQRPIPAGVDSDEATEALRRHVTDNMPWE